jgi:hypothetical protein
MTEQDRSEQGESEPVTRDHNRELLLQAAQEIDATDKRNIILLGIVGFIVSFLIAGLFILYIL